MRKIKNSFIFILGTYLLCFLFRVVEYMFIRTDRTMIGEAFIHKIIGIIILTVAVWYLHYHWSDIGFQRKGVVRYTILGLLLGCTTFLVAYSTEMLLQIRNGNSPELQLFISSYSINGSNVMQTSVLFFLICILGNIINVVMEEGVFRGLFVKLFEDKASFIKAMLLSSLLFGIWHIVAPLREFLDGNMQMGMFIVAALMQILLTGLMGIKLCLLVKITGSLWMAMADHFTNNFIINILHIVTVSGIDEMQVIRISVAQTLSFLIILFIFWRKKSYQRNTFC